METQQNIQHPALSINQRNLYFYFLAHKKKHGKQPCFVPKVSVQGNRMSDYIKALNKLEEYRLISVDRSSANYTGWIMKEPTNT